MMPTIFLNGYEKMVTKVRLLWSWEPWQGADEKEDGYQFLINRAGGTTAKNLQW